MSEDTDLIEEILNLQRPTGVGLSPNAQQVVYTTSLLGGHKIDKYSLSTIWLAETGKAKSSRQLTSGLYNDRDACWSPDGKTIAFLSDRGKQGESSAVYLLPVHASGEAYPITPATNEKPILGMKWSPDGNFVAFISTDEKTAEEKAREEEKDDPNVWGEGWRYQRLRTVHVTTKKVTTLFDQEAHVVDFAWNDDGSKIVFATTETPDGESGFRYGMTIAVLNVDDKHVTQVCHYPGMMNNFAWTGDTIYFIARSNPEHLSTARMVYSIDMKSPSPTYGKNAYGETKDGASLRKIGQDIVVKVEEGLEDKIQMLGGREVFSKKKEIGSWDAAFTTDSDEMIIAIAQGDINSPEEIFTVTASGGAMVQLSSHGEGLGKRDFGTPNFISCDSKSVCGEPVVRLDGVFVVPNECNTTNGKPDTPLPAVVVIHGGPYTRNTDQFDPSYYTFVPHLLGAGYGVLTINFRGSSGRGEQFASYTHGGLGVYDYADVIEMIQHAISEGYANKERLIVHGWSGGGSLSYLCSTRNGQHEYGWKFRAAIPGAGITDHATMAMTSDLGVVAEKFAGRAPWTAHKDDVTDRQGSALWEFAEAAKKNCIPPMLILHGEVDLRVPIEQARGFRRALVAAKLPFEYVSYPREGHIFQERKHFVDMVQRVIRFVDTHIGGT